MAAGSASTLPISALQEEEAEEAALLLVAVVVVIAKVDMAEAEATLPTRPAVTVLKVLIAKAVELLDRAAMVVKEVSPEATPLILSKATRRRKEATRKGVSQRKAAFQRKEVIKDNKAATVINLYSPTCESDSLTYAFPFVF